MKRLLFSLFSFLFSLSSFAPPVYAQTATPQPTEYTATSGCVITNYGNSNATPTIPPQCGSGAGDYGLQLVRDITNHTNCYPNTGMQANGFGLPFTDYTNPTFRRANKGDPCLKDSRITADALPNWTTIRDSADYLGYYGNGDALQCVGFANAVLKGANNIALIPQHNAKDYANHQTDYPDYQWYDYNYNTGATNGTMKPGDAVIFQDTVQDPKGNFGHIAIVVKVVSVQSSMIKFIVAEGNGNGRGEVDLRSELSNGTVLQLLGWFHKK